MVMVWPFVPLFLHSFIPHSLPLPVSPFNCLSPIPSFPSTNSNCRIETFQTHALSTPTNSTATDGTIANKQMPPRTEHFARYVLIFPCICTRRRCYDVAGDDWSLFDLIVSALKKGGGGESGSGFDGFGGGGSAGAGMVDQAAAEEIGDSDKFTHLGGSGAGCASGLPARSRVGVSV